MKINIAHLYSESLNLYGDLGNIVTLSQRLSWRGFEAQVINYELGDNISSVASCDIFFIGGGQDAQQVEVAKDMLMNKKFFQDAVASDKVLLSICGGYQLLGQYYQTSTGDNMPGLEILDVFTQAIPDHGAKQDRLIGNVSAELNIEMQSGSKLKTLVGFENHSGRTYVLESSTHTKPLARIIHGNGNNSSDGYEGAYRQNFFGTYFHGSLLPKNPHFADELLYRALSVKYGDFPFAVLDDSLELSAHHKALSLKS